MWEEGLGMLSVTMQRVDTGPPVLPEGRPLRVTLAGAVVTQTRHAREHSVLTTDAAIATCKHNVTSCLPGGEADWDNNGPNVNDHLDLKYGDLFWWELSAYYSWLGPEIWWMTQNNLCCCVTLTGREKKSYTKENTKSILQDFLHRIGQLYVSADLTRASRGYLCWGNYSYNDTSCLTSLCSAEFKNSNLLASIFQWPQECWKLVWILLAGWKSWSGRSSKHFPTGYIHHTGHVMRRGGGGYNWPTRHLVWGYTTTFHSNYLS